MSADTESGKIKPDENESIDTEFEYTEYVET